MFKYAKQNPERDGKPFGGVRGRDGKLKPVYEPLEFEKHLNHTLALPYRPSTIKQKKGAYPIGGMLTSTLLSALISGGLGAGIGALTGKEHRGYRALFGAGIGATIGTPLIGPITSGIVKEIARNKKGGKKEYLQYAENLDKNAWKHLLPFYGSYTDGLQGNLLDSLGTNAVVGQKLGPNDVMVFEEYK